MVDLEAAADRMRKASYQGADAVNEGPKELFFYLADGQPLGSGAFFWYRTKAELLNALASDLVGLMYAPESAADSDVSRFLARVAEITLRVPEDSPLPERLKDAINTLLDGRCNIEHIGAYQDLVDGHGAWERETRVRFRKTQEITSATDPGDPINEEERDDFDAFVTGPSG